MKEVFALVAFLTFALAGPVKACSLASCLNSGAELRSNFHVSVTFGKKGLPGVGVQITGAAQNGAPQFWYRLTGSNGTAYFENLPAGEYWIQAELLGIWAGSECFHIKEASSKGAKGVRRYQWGDMPYGIYHSSGRIVERQPGKEGNPLQRLLHRVEVPMADTNLELRSPGGAIFAATSDSDGRFAFANVPDGLYVLHIEDPRAPIVPDDILVNLGDQTRRSEMLITRSDPIAGSCGGTDIRNVDRKPAS